jgi:hypothetical protein
MSFLLSKTMSFILSLVPNGTSKLTIFYLLGQGSDCLPFIFAFFSRHMGNLSCLFGPTESPGQFIGTGSFVVLHPCYIGVMLSTPAEGRFLTNDLPQTSTLDTDCAASILVPY